MWRLDSRFRGNDRRLWRHNATLRETRDLLLPRLISGEVSVKGPFPV